MEISRSSLLHINSYYVGNKLYKKLFKNIELEYEQFVYVPVKSAKYVGVNSFKSNKTHFIYDNFLKPYHKYLFGLKVYSQAKRIESYLGIQRILELKLIHAHTIFSDGGSAYILYKKYKIPYVVSVRNTDLNFFYKYAIHYRPLAHKILLEAKEIIFISYAYLKHFFNILPEKIVNKIEGKCIVIPNGISDVFFRSEPKRKNIESINLITMASLNKNKNISTLIKVVVRLKEMGKRVSLKIIGDGPLLQELKDMVEIENVKDNVYFLGHIDSYSIKKNLDSSNIFLLLSIKETFGISYIEAMARGLPIVYTKNEGIDGYFNNGEVGFSVNPLNVNDTCKAIEEIIENYDVLTYNCRLLSQDFSWGKIGISYMNLYLK